MNSVNHTVAVVDQPRIDRWYHDSYLHTQLNMLIAHNNICVVINQYMLLET
jgi:hypothetical protein